MIVAIGEQLLLTMAEYCGYWKAVALDNGRIYKESLLRSKKREEYKNKKKDKEMRIV